jgi:hypothetical protein
MMDIAIACSDDRCAQALGVIGPSIRSGNPRPVWRIRPGWMFTNGILEHIDERLSSERRLYHEVTGGRRPVGVAMIRECDLPLCVRCPRCHRMRWVAPDAALVLAR